MSKKFHSYSRNINYWSQISTVTATVTATSTATTAAAAAAKANIHYLILVRTKKVAGSLKRNEIIP
jgi:hypothetical protein